jgi:hypothetical protein
MVQSTTGEAAAGVWECGRRYGGRAAMDPAEWAAKASSSLNRLESTSGGFKAWLHLPESDISIRRAGYDSVQPLKKPDPM